LDTVANALAHRYRDRTYVFRPVNRLDRDTSGCMLTANTKDASYKMYTSMVDGKIRKAYIAILHGVMEEREGYLVSYMHRRDESIIAREECSADAPGAKRAVTYYKTVAENGEYSLVIAHPLTGRTHQLRVHFSARGHAIVGDSLYGEASEHIARHALHSWKTRFPHPLDSRVIELTAPVSADIVSLAESVGLELCALEKETVFEDIRYEQE
ncbi:MAG: RNA pseudouridine synthase, partial [Clostridia bacterium]|nr:RNA pseudouridine synthase [Clostridia bacterium]